MYERNITRILLWIIKWISERGWTIITVNDNQS